MNCTRQRNWRNSQRYFSYFSYLHAFHYSDINRGRPSARAQADMAGEREQKVSIRCLIRQNEQIDKEEDGRLSSKWKTTHSRQRGFHFLSGNVIANSSNARTVKHCYSLQRRRLMMMRCLGKKKISGDD